MYSILLVEDEKIELDTLKNYVDWKGVGIDEVYTARGGRSALECINASEPDILITDIQMPGMSGIDLVDIVRQEGHRCKVVFLTGYDKFEYAKEAIRLQVEDFLLKPFQIEEVESVVRKLLLKIEKEEKEKESNRLALGKMLERAGMGDTHDLDNLAEYYFQKPAAQVSVNVLALKGLSEEARQKFRRNTEILHAFYRDQLFFIILPNAIWPKLFLSQIQRVIQDEPFQAIYCDEKVGLTDLQGAFHKIHCCEDDLFYSDIHTAVSCSDHVERKPYEDRIKTTMEKKALLEAILAGEKEKALEILDQCLELFSDMERGGFCQNSFSLFLYLHRQLDSSGNLDGAAEVPNILHADRGGIVRDNFRRYVDQCCNASRNKSDSRWASYVYDFVQQHYMEDCTVEEMAEGINVSPNYLRRKFKEESGMTILEYITETRMKVAASLLEDGKHRIKEVSIAVGYPNISYFTQLFSKKYGVTPNEYKKNN